MKAVEIYIPPDKSISHRAVMLASISEGTTRIKNLLMAEDIKRTIEAFRAMGVDIRVGRHASCVVRGVGMRGLKKPKKPLYLGNSGTTMRILPGILAGQGFEAVLTGDESLSARPMKRIIEPLRKMGVDIGAIRSTHDARRDIYPPLRIRGGKLKAIKYKSKIASAQLKSCILLAGLFADGVTSIAEPVKSRDHTERMLKMFGCGPRITGNRVMVKGPVKLKSPGRIEVPGDISSAAFFITAGCVLPGMRIVIKDVGLNPTRTGVVDILRRMEADIRVMRHARRATPCEPSGDIIVESSKLKGVNISPNEVTEAIDEMPIIMVAACFAKGRTTIRGIGELRVKETDRIKSMVTNLRKIGADIQVTNKEEIVINGGRPLRGARVSSFGDHRTAMSMLVAGLNSRGRVLVTGLDCIKKSFPGFEDLLRKLN
ncbi:MAG: 3-phosphoshikimate 1-carboxyvinyltransferase [Candidatus Omnitrophota bacterium]